MSQVLSPEQCHGNAATKNHRSASAGTSYRGRAETSSPGAIMRSVRPYTPLRAGR